jgi:hypothetical protein
MISPCQSCQRDQRADSIRVPLQPCRHARDALPFLRYANSAIEAARGADLMLALTGQPDFRDLNPAK